MTSTSRARKASPARSRHTRSGTRMPAARRREQIVRAFIREALQRGSIAGVGVRAVVARAECTAPVLYRLFGDRGGLVHAAVRSTHVPMIERLEAIVSDHRGLPTQRLRSLASSYLERRPGEAEAFEALVANECRSDPVLARFVCEVFDRFEQLLTELVIEGIERGEIGANVDPDYVAWRIIDIGLFRNQAHLMGLKRPGRIGYGMRALESLLAEISA